MNTIIVINITEAEAKARECNSNRFTVDELDEECQAALTVMTERVLRSSIEIKKDKDGNIEWRSEW
ncbi:hypothetical protein GCM10023116_15520 [Kistimonas scapharcae]|uniref:Uncharacterized protein n=1 Tax=Kistimonas scapharcae TaxID=1036133 RepID=A0ABP8UZ76_9GAMM